MERTDIRRIHFIGIGGVGMSGIALVAHDQGMVVSGSDLRESRYTRQLAEAGVTVHIGHDPSNLPPEGELDVVVVSTAILDNNPEYRAALERGVPVWHRAKMLAQLGLGKRTLAVAGTHGKTTTSSMLASALVDLGTDPTFLIGGIVRAFGTNAHSGAGPFYALEADESDKSFTYLDPYGILVTNIESDHLDHYADVAEIEAKFAEFMSQAPAEGLLVVCADDERLMRVARSLGRPFATYGFSEGADVRILEWADKGVGSTFAVRLASGERVEGGLRQNPGRHNVSNAAGVLALIEALGLDAQAAAESLRGFAGVKRRFDLVDEVAGVTVVDDYAHHPTEIAATIRAARGLGFSRVAVLFQPHRYSRVGLFTEVLRHEFAHAFDDADLAFFMDVYAAGETPVPGVSGATFMEVLSESERAPERAFIERRQDTVARVADALEPGDLLITMGAGDVTALGPLIVAELRARHEARA